jgi:predicted RNA-binding protein with PIN domain
MAARIIVDGYNLMYAGQGLHPDSLLDHEKAREDLLLKLSRYKKTTGNKITVVFDGSLEAPIHSQRTSFAGIEVRFSRPPRSADDLIGRLTRGSAKGSIVVTSDREVAGAAERGGCTVISSQEFMDRVEFAAIAKLKGNIEEYPDKPMGTKKRGNPRRPSKKERKRKARLKNL